MKDKPIFSPTIAGKLIDLGFTMTNQVRNHEDPSKWVYFFPSTPELLDAFDKILVSRNKT